MPSSGELHDSVSFLARVGAVTGYADGTFGISRIVTRGQAAKILTVEHGVRIPAKTTGQFTDSDPVFGVYAEAAAAEGWVTGYADGTFRAYASAPAAAHGGHRRAQSRLGGRRQRAQLRRPSRVR